MCHNEDLKVRVCVGGRLWGESKAEGYIHLNDMGAVYCGINFDEDLGNLYGQLNLMYSFSWHRIEKEGPV